MQRRSRLALLAGLALTATGCDWYYNDVPSPDDLWHITPWFDHMIAQKSVHPYSRADIPRYTPEGTVPLSGGEPDWSAEFGQGKTTTADALKNPTGGAEGPISRHGAATPEIPGSLDAKGDTLFQNFCSPCHGPAGAGDGPVGRRMGAPPLLSPRARGFSDGYIYSIIRYGRGLMPRYGDKVFDPIDRWAIVNHVRKLQAAAPQPAAAPTPEPQPTQPKPAAPKPAAPKPKPTPGAPQ
jgi:mono/diheme cytochrome c family protein